MQVYIIGIGQCGTSVAYDVIADLTGFVKSKDVTSKAQSAEGVEAATNDLLDRMNKDLDKSDLWRARIAPWLNRLFGASPGRKAFMLPKIAIIDGNPDNFVKNAFGKFAGGFAVEDKEDNDRNLRQLAQLIGDTRVLGLGQWASGCANSLVGEVVTTANLQPANLRNS